MALLATLQLGNNQSKSYSKEFLVTDIRCHMRSEHNRYRPSSKAFCERIEMTVVTPGKKDLTLLEWYANRSTLCGRIVIEMTTISKETYQQPKVIKFENAICFRISEDYDINNKLRRLLSLSLEAESVTTDEVTF